MDFKNVQRHALSVGFFTCGRLSFFRLFTSALKCDILRPSISWLNLFSADDRSDFWRHASNGHSSATSRRDLAWTSFANETIHTNTGKSSQHLKCSNSFNILLFALERFCPFCWARACSNGSFGSILFIHFDHLRPYGRNSHHPLHTPSSYTSRSHLPALHKTTDSWAKWNILTKRNWTLSEFFIRCSRREWTLLAIASPKALKVPTETVEKWDKVWCGQVIFLTWFAHPGHWATHFTPKQTWFFQGKLVSLVGIAAWSSKGGFSILLYFSSRSRNLWKSCFTPLLKPDSFILFSFTAFRKPMNPHRPAQAKALRSSAALHFTSVLWFFLFGRVQRATVL